MKIKIWGTRGSTPISGKGFGHFGGNTTCVEVVSDSGVRCIIDAGTGIRDLGNSLLTSLPVHLHLFFSHYHWDHCIGFPFFVPAFIPGNTIEIYGQNKGKLTAEDILDQRLMTAPNFPVPLAVMGATLKFHRLPEKRGVVKLDKGFSVETAPVFHPNGVVGFRFVEGKKVFTFITDVEHQAPDYTDKEPLYLARNAQVLAYDCQYTTEEYQTRVNWGHSTWQAGLAISEKSGVSKLLMIHHDPAHTDKEVRSILRGARRSGKKLGIEVDAAFEGMNFEI
jgi:phosphoribosyl 1,2-cyclic phosphodiesterase